MDDNNDANKQEQGDAANAAPPKPQDESQFTPPKGKGFTSPVVANKKRPGKGLWLIVVILVLATGGGLLGYMWVSEKDRANQLNQQVESLKQQKQATSNKADTQEAEAAKAQYQAEVGKFTLTLPETYYIIVEHDGGFEGGPITLLTVGKKGQDGTQTVDAPSHQSVEVRAVPSGETVFEDRVSNALTAHGGTSSELAAVEVDGVDAEVYRLAGLFNDKKLFFENNDVFYAITAGNVQNDQSASQAILDDVVAGFKFDS